MALLLYTRASQPKKKNITKAYLIGNHPEQNVIGYSIQKCQHRDESNNQKLKQLRGFYQLICEMCVSGFGTKINLRHLKSIKNN